MRAARTCSAQRNQQLRWASLSPAPGFLPGHSVVFVPAFWDAESNPLGQGSACGPACQLDEEQPPVCPLQSSGSSGQHPTRSSVPQLSSPQAVPSGSRFIGFSFARHPPGWTWQSPGCALGGYQRPEAVLGIQRACKSCAGRCPSRAVTSQRFYYTQTMACRSPGCFPQTQNPARGSCIQPHGLGTASRGACREQPISLRARVPALFLQPSCDLKKHSG